MAVKIQNVSNQVVPVIIPAKDGGEEKRLQPRESIVITTLSKPTAQMVSLCESGYLKLR